MKIRLYKNCILSNSYSEVFDTKIKDSDGKTAFDRYLETLDYYDVPYSQTDELIYYSNSGTITFDYAVVDYYGSIYEFNYMRCIGDTNAEYEDIIKRYCFINDIKLGNGTATITYTEDIWHSYFSSMHVRNSYLTNSRKLNYGNRNISFYRLPLDYQGNNKAVINQIETNNKYFIICQFQPYSLESGGDVSERETYTVLIGKRRLGAMQPRYEYFEVKKFTLEECTKILTNLQKNSAKRNFLSVDVNRRTEQDFEHRYYQMDNFTIIPEYLANTFFLEDTGYSPLAITGNGSIEEDDISMIDISRILDYRTQHDGYINVYNGTLESNFRVKSFGTFTSQYELDQNGSNIPFSIYFNYNNYDFKIMLNIQNKVIDITNDFVVDVPFESVTGDVTAQRRIAKQIKIFNDSMKIVDGIVEIASSVISMNAGIDKTSVSYLTKSGKISNSLVSQIKRESDYKTEGVQGGKGIIGGLASVTEGIFGIIMASKPQYLTSNGTFVSSAGLLNALFGLCYMEIDSDNDNSVEDFINNIGYTVFEIIGDEVFSYNFTDYNIVKFDFINLYGNFSQEIANGLKLILTNGIKIWYTENV